MKEIKEMKDWQRELLVYGGLSMISVLIALYLGSGW